MCKMVWLRGVGVNGCGCECSNIMKHISVTKDTLLRVTLCTLFCNTSTTPASRYISPNSQDEYLYRSSDYVNASENIIMTREQERIIIFICHGTP